MYQKITTYNAATRTVGLGCGHSLDIIPGTMDHAPVEFGRQQWCDECQRRNENKAQDTSAQSGGQKFKNLGQTTSSVRYGSPEFYNLLGDMAAIHSRKSHDYASNSTPYANYEFAGKLSQLFKNPDDAGFVGRIGEKLYRLANLEGKITLNESVEDTEVDLCTIMVLWMASRREKRQKNDGKYDNATSDKKQANAVEKAPGKSLL